MGAGGKRLAHALPAGAWEVDGARSEVAFEVTHLRFTHVRGRFTRFQGTVDVDRGRMSVTGGVEVTSIDTGDERRDHYLRTAEEFFDPERHPRIVFSAGPASVAGERAFGLQGELTIRGTSRPLGLEVEVEDPASGDGGADEMVLRARGELQRGEYGLRFPTVAGYGDALVGDTVKIVLRVVLVRAPSTRG